MYAHHLRRLASLTLLAAAAFPATAEAVEHMPSGGVHLSWTLGPDGGQLGWGVHLTDMLLLRGEARDGACGETHVGLGPTVQFGMRGLEAPRVVLALAGGLDPTESVAIEGAHLEAGLALPLGGLGRLGLHGAAVLSSAYTQALVRTAPGMEEPIAVGAGVTWPGPFHYAERCYDDVIIEGRPARSDDGSPTTAPVRAEAEFGEVASAWAETARHECSSIPTFLLLAAELVDAGAPPHLVGRALDAAEDEIRHARMAARVATHLSGTRVWPVLPPPPARSRLERTPSLVRMATEGVVDGAMGEGAAADEAELASREARDPRVAAHYRQIAVEERRHAHLGRDVAAWALSAGGEPVREALLPLREAAPDRLSPSPDVPDRLSLAMREGLRTRRAAVERAELAAALG